MKHNLLWAAVAVVAMSASIGAYAQHPLVNDGTHVSSDTAINIADVDLLQEIEQTLSADDATLWLTWAVLEPSGDENPQPLAEFTWRIGVPSGETESKYRPSVVVLGPGLPALSGLPFDVPEGAGGVLVDTASLQWENGPDGALLTPVNTLALDEAGQYYVVAFQPNGEPGEFSLLIGHRFGLLDAVVAKFATANIAFVKFCTAVFHPILRPFFAIFDKILTPIGQPFFTIFALIFFVSPMLWVGFYLKKSYVNLDCPRPAWYTDLRLWTVLSMLPHVIVYLYFY